MVESLDDHCLNGEEVEETKSLMMGRCCLGRKNVVRQREIEAKIQQKQNLTCPQVELFTL